jgi:hypothetical protein
MRVIILLFLLLFIGLPVAAQEYEKRLDSLYEQKQITWNERTNAIHDTRSSLSITEYEFKKKIDVEPIKDTLTKFVYKEHMRFLLQLHPAYAGLDSIEKATILKSDNPFEPMMPETKVLKWKPHFHVRILNELFLQNYKYRHLYIVSMSQEFYFPGIEQANGNVIYFYEAYFIVYYVPEMNDIRIIGGPAFLRNIPLEAFEGGDHDFIQTHAYIKTFNALEGCTRQSDGRRMFVNGRTFKDSIEVGNVHWCDVCELWDQNIRVWKYFEMVDGTGHIGLNENAFGKNRKSIQIKLREPCFRTCGYVIILSDADPDYPEPPPVVFGKQSTTDSIEILYYEKTPLLHLKRWYVTKGINSSREFIYPYFELGKTFFNKPEDVKKKYPYYEIRQVFYNNPKKYEDTLPKIRGVSQEEIDRLRPKYGHLIYDE